MSGLFHNGERETILGRNGEKEKILSHGQEDDYGHIEGGYTFLHLLHTRCNTITGGERVEKTV